MVQAAVLTGARYGELGRLTAADFDADAGMLFIAVSKGDKSRHVSEASISPSSGRMKDSICPLAVA